MDTNKRDLLVELGFEDLIVFDNPDYDSAIIGFDANYNRVIYDFDLMVQHLMETDSMTEEDAIEFIEYNTIRACPYFGDNAPIILRKLE